MNPTILTVVNQLSNDELLERTKSLAEDLLRHQIPNGDPAEIFDRALTVLLENLAKRKLAATDRPRESRDPTPGSRCIPAEVKRAVWLRDGGRCAFIGRNGRRCTEQGFLEFHHITPHAVGGESTVDNIQLRCRAHNGYEAALDFRRPWNLPAMREERASYTDATTCRPVSIDVLDAELPEPHEDNFL